MRIAPLDPPYPPEMQAGFDRVMAGKPPLLLFRVVARNPRVLSRLFAGGLLDKGSVSLRQRELMIELDELVVRENLLQIRPQGIVDVMQLAGFYHMVAFTLRAFRVPLEASAPRFPAR